MLLEDATRSELEQEILKLWEQIGDLEEKLAELKAEFRNETQLVNELQDELEQLTNENSILSLGSAKLKECVEFYAEADYEVKVDRQGYVDSSAWTYVLPEIVEDAGQRAREVLKELDHEL